MDDHQTEAKLPQIVLVFQSLIDRDQDIKPVLDQGQQEVILQRMPAHFERCPYLVSGEEVGDSGVNARI